MTEALAGAQGETDRLKNLEQDLENTKSEIRTLQVSLEQKETDLELWQTRAQALREQLETIEQSRSYRLARFLGRMTGGFRRGS
jgi:hypothetical protein